MRRVALVLCAAALAVALLPLPASAAPPPTPYLPPVEAPVVDGFRPPETRYGPGNRGLEYGTEPGAAVAAVADGVVTFAGTVAGTRHVTVRHADGVRTTYSFLARVDVVGGQSVRQGQVLGTTTARLHLGARRGDAYFDPASLFGAGPADVRLVPFDEPPGAGSAGERSAIGQLVGGLGGLLASGSDWLRSSGQIIGTFAEYHDRFLSPTAFVHNGLALLGAWQRARVQADRPCSGPGVAPAPPAERRIALLVAGLGSNSRHATVDDVDTAGLGYEPPDVLRFSYAGGRTPDASDGLTALPTTSYGPADTQRDLRATAQHLADLVEATAEAEPGVPIDVYAHSQGGVVTRLALIELERRHGVDWLRALGLVATLGSPHGGADLATAVHAISSSPSGGEALDVYREATGIGIDDDAASVAQLSETSGVVAELARHPIPEVVAAVSIAARGDLIVTVPSTRAPGATEVVVPLVGLDAHSDLPGSAEANRELRLALAGLPPGCQTFRDTLLDQGTGEAVSYGEDLLGALGWFVAGGTDARG